MYTLWTQHLKTKKDIKNFENQILRSKDILDRQKEILKQQIESLERLELDPRSFSSPNWDYRQAYNLGWKACATFTNKLINLDQQKDTNDPRQSITE